MVCSPVCSSDHDAVQVLALLNISLIGAGVPPLDDPGKGGSSDDLKPVTYNHSHQGLKQCVGV